MSNTLLEEALKIARKSSDAFVNSYNFTVAVEEGNLTAIAAAFMGAASVMPGPTGIFFFYGCSRSICSQYSRKNSA